LAIVGMARVALPLVATLIVALLIPLALVIPLIVIASVHIPIVVIGLITLVVIHAGLIVGAGIGIPVVIAITALRKRQAAGKYQQQSRAEYSCTHDVTPKSI